jgi:hypothetical protein
MTSSERDTSENEILQNNLNPEQIFPFALDEFQLKAIDSLNQALMSARPLLRFLFDACIHIFHALVLQRRDRSCLFSF